MRPSSAVYTPYLAYVSASLDRMSIDQYIYAQPVVIIVVTLLYPFSNVSRVACGAKPFGGRIFLYAIGC